MNYFDYVIVGGGMSGLSVAYQLLKGKGCAEKKILLLERENETGQHSSGRNSGVIHAGVYYKPDTLKAKVCVSGGRRLIEWINHNKLQINNCGKMIVAQDYELDPQLDILAKRATQNGADVKLVDLSTFKSKLPHANAPSNRALWSPNTSVVNPKTVVKTLTQELKEKGIMFKHNFRSLKIETRQVLIDSEEVIEYGHLFNCSGAYAADLAKQVGIGKNYRVIPFKGLYWDLKYPSRFNINCNLYPVPDLDVPFLGVHFTPNANGGEQISIGPTATLGLGKKNYKTWENLEIKESLINTFILGKQYLMNKGKFKKYVHEQSLLWIESLMIREAQKLIPMIKQSDIIASNKVGIRAQVFDLETEELADDFICISNETSTHVINAVSPAFTASFSLGDLIIKKAGLA